METTVKQRIREFIRHENMSDRAFTQSINVSPSYINNISKSMGIDIIYTIKSTYPKLNIEWLLTGFGDMIHEETDSIHQKSSSESNQSSELVEALRSHISDLQSERDRLIDEREEMKAEIDRLRRSLGMEPMKKETA